MANFCPNCGRQVNAGDRFCAECGTSLSGNTSNNNNTYANNGGGTASTSGMGAILGTLVAVSLIGGITRQLYYYNGRYFYDPYCRRSFMSPHMILGRPRPCFHPGLMHRRPGHPMRPPMGPHGGGPRGPMGGGPRGGGFGGPGGGPRGGGPGGRR